MNLFRRCLLESLSAKEGVDLYVKSVTERYKYKKTTSSEQKVIRCRWQVTFHTKLQILIVIISLTKYRPYTYVVFYTYHIVSAGEVSDFLKWFQIRNYVRPLVSGLSFLTFVAFFLSGFVAVPSFFASIYAPGFDLFFLTSGLLFVGLIVGLDRTSDWAYPDEAGEDLRDWNIQLLGVWEVAEK